MKTCVGEEFCRYGLGDSTALGVAIEERYKAVHVAKVLPLNWKAAQEQKAA